ncbi:MAG: hypothetical protein U0930_11240 [Pirellulales bacterium]
MKGTGPGGRVLKEDALAAGSKTATPLAPAATSAPAAQPTAPTTKSQGQLQVSVPSPRALRRVFRRMEEIKPLSMIRRTIANRLVEARHNCCIVDYVQRSQYAADHGPASWRPETHSNSVMA